MEPAMCLCAAVASCQIHTQNNRHINILAEYQRQIEMYAQIDRYRDSWISHPNIHLVGGGGGGGGRGGGRGVLGVVAVVVMVTARTVPGLGDVLRVELGKGPSEGS